MDSFIDLLKQKGFEGDVDDGVSTRDLYSHDASMFEMMPKLVVSPKNASDIEKIIQSVNELKPHHPDLSLTARSAGTDMSGGAINDSIICDFGKYFTKIEKVTDREAQSQPGVFYRDFEKETLKKHALLPSFPASRELCTIGGMVNNNSGGELSLSLGKTEDYVTELDMVLADAKSYQFKVIKTPAELKKKMQAKTFEGEIYRELYKLIEANYDLIKKSKPQVSKNSTGYNLWDVWDRESGIFDINKLIVGAQGTLGFVTDIHCRLVKEKPFSGVLVCFMKNINNLGEVINAVLPHKPASFESFDNYTIGFSIKFLPFFRKTIGYKGLIKLAISLIPDALLLFKGIPKMILLIEFTGESQQEVDEQINSMQSELKANFKLEGIEDDNTPAKAWKFRIMRRESFNILRSKVKDKHTAPFIDDLIVPPKYLVEFLPKLRAILSKYKLLATIAGHVGDGNFHVIPLMKFELETEKAKIEPSMKEVNDLVLSYGGSLSGEHNDGLVRGPWLEAKYGREMTEIFKKTKEIFDSQNIFNPHKKTDANWEFSLKHIREHF